MGESGGSHADLVSAAAKGASQEPPKGAARAAGSGESPLPPEPSPETGIYIAKYALQFLAVVGGGGVGVAGVAAAVGLLAHKGHLAMLGLPHFPMSPEAYSQIALQFFTHSLRAAVSYPPLSMGWLIATLVLVVVVWAYPWLCRKGYLRSGGTTCRYAYSSVLHLLCLFAVVIFGGQLLRLSTTAFTGQSRNQIWVVYSNPDDALGQRPGENVDYLSDANIRWCLFHRGSTEPKDRGLASRKLRDYYCRLVGGIGLILLLFIAAQRGRRHLAKQPTGPGDRDPPGLHAAADMMLEVPAVVILTVLLIALPANYGALIMPTEYQNAQIVEESGKRIIASSASGDTSETGAEQEIIDSGFFLSPALSDTKSMSLLKLTIVESSMRWTLRTVRLDPPWQIELEGPSDILEEIRSQMEAPGG